MSPSTVVIREFPKDDSLWFVKWIDEFRIPHLGTRSASVSVILQKLPFSDISEVGKLKPEELFQILGQRNKDPNVEVLPANPLVMPGTLPMLYIGAIFKNKVRVGELPVKRKQLTLQRGGQEGTEITLGEELEAPSGWTKGAAYRILNKYEYSVALHKMPRSRCLVIKRRGITYVIPRMSIFKTFYACHTELAKAFCNGPWPERLEDVIYLPMLESGLKTEITADGQWNMIVQTRVPDSFAVILALFYFDPFARACAESIYSKSLQDRNGITHEPWYASAQIPFRETYEPFHMDVRGFELRGWKYTDEDGVDAVHKKFLVTEIVSTTWPDWIPIIGRERYNSGRTGKEQIRVDGPRPYPKKPEPDSENPEIEIDGEDDADATTSALHMNAIEFSWLNQPKTIKLDKKSSKHYTEPDGPRRPPTDGSRVSTGEDTHQFGNPSKGEAEIRIRLPEKRFEHILEALQQLVDKNIIESIAEFPCPIPGKQIRRGSLQCWSFIDEETLKNNYRPRRGWRIAEYDADNPKKSLYRSALVVKLMIKGGVHYWIEIECRKSERGFRSPLLSNVTSNETEIINAALEVIVECGGVSMESRLNALLRSHSITADCYKHFYARESSKFDIESIKRFLMGR
jgi:hypothetical protein